MSRAYMLLDELADDLKPVKTRRGRGPSNMPDVDEIMQRRRMLERGSNWSRYEEAQDGDARAILDASPARIDQLLAPPPGTTGGENRFQVERASREESTFFNPNVPPPNGPDGVPLFDE